VKWTLKSWRGDEVVARIARASKLAIDETTHACVIPAKDRVHVKTRLLQGSIQAKDAVYTPERGWIGRWGSFNVNYALAQEISPEPKGKAYLRPAAQKEYPKLVDRLKAHLQ